MLGKGVLDAGWPGGGKGPWNWAGEMLEAAEGCGGKGIRGVVAGEDHVSAGEEECCEGVRLYEGVGEG